MDHGHTDDALSFADSPLSGSAGTLHAQPLHLQHHQAALAASTPAMDDSADITMSGDDSHNGGREQVRVCVCWLRAAECGSAALMEPGPLTCADKAP